MPTPAQGLILWVMTKTALAVDARGQDVQNLNLINHLIRNGFIKGVPRIVELLMESAMHISNICKMLSSKIKRRTRGVGNFSNESSSPRRVACFLCYAGVA